MTTRGVLVFVDGPNASRIVAHQLFGILTPCLDPERQPAIQTFRDAVSALYPTFPVSSNTIYFHVRSGEFFGPPPVNGHHGQPACNYYLEAAALHPNVSEMVMMTDGGANPCIADLASRGAVVDRSPRNPAFATLIRARRFALGLSSFSDAVFRLSHFYYSGKFYTFGRPEVNLGRHWNCEPTDEYAIGAHRMEVEAASIRADANQSLQTVVVH
jgi:hypothetical protein